MNCTKSLVLLSAMLSLVSHRVSLSRRELMRSFYGALGLQLVATEHSDVFRYQAPDCAGSELQKTFQAIKRHQIHSFI